MSSAVTSVATDWLDHVAYALPYSDEDPFIPLSLLPDIHRPNCLICGQTMLNYSEEGPGHLETVPKTPTTFMTLPPEITILPLLMAFGDFNSDPRLYAQCRHAVRGVCSYFLALTDASADAWTSLYITFDTSYRAMIEAVNCAKISPVAIYLDLARNSVMDRGLWNAMEVVEFIDSIFTILKRPLVRCEEFKISSMFDVASYAIMQHVPHIYAPLLHVLSVNCIGYERAPISYPFIAPTLSPDLSSLTDMHVTGLYTPSGWPGLPARSQLRSLTLRNLVMFLCPSWEDLVAIFRAAPVLEHLSLKYVDCSCRPDPVKLPPLPLLKSLHVASLHPTNLEIMSKLDMPALTSFHLESPSQADLRFFIFSCGASLKNLTSMRLSSYGLTATHLRSLLVLTPWYLWGNSDRTRRTIPTEGLQLRYRSTFGFGELRPNSKKNNSNS
ncbi:hypothetical protein C8R43DRAFT_1140591 [Mycena crocata]|nr:hypothetical protein C8R43DRAFT_1140591 [Mycena crocata]